MTFPWAKEEASLEALPVVSSNRSWLGHREGRTACPPLFDSCSEGATLTATGARPPGSSSNLAATPLATPVLRFPRRSCKGTENRSEKTGASFVE